MGERAIPQDLRSAVERLGREFKAVHVTAPVDWRYEAAAVLWEMAHGPAVVFDRVADYEMPLVGNLLNTRDKLATLLEVAPDQLTDRIVDAVENRTPVSEVVDAPCQEVVHEDGIDIGAMFPVPLISEHDSGRYISAGIVIARDPTSGRQNLSICRLQLQGPDRLGVNFAPTHSWQFLQHRADRGERMEVAVAIGCHPVLMAASQLLVPFDEAEAAGTLFGSPLRVVRGKTVDLLVPADAEVVLEAVIDPTERNEEGPFGEFAGSYAPARPNPVLHVRAVTTRRDPWFQMIVGGTHPEHLVTGAVAREATLLRSIRAVVPGARRVVLTEGGNCRFHAVVSIDQRNPGEARLAITAAFAAQDLIKFVIVVDDDIDPGDPEQVEWAMGTRMRADRDLIVIPGMKSNPVDPMSIDRTITKLGVDATLPVGSPLRGQRLANVPVAARDQVRRRWSELFPDREDRHGD